MSKCGTVKKIVLLSILCQWIQACNLETHEFLIVKKRITPDSQNVFVVTTVDTYKFGEFNSKVEYAGERNIGNPDESFCALEEKLKRFAEDNHKRFDFEKNWEFVIQKTQSSAGMAYMTLMISADNQKSPDISITAYNEEEIGQLEDIKRFSEEGLDIAFLDISNSE